MLKLLNRRWQMFDASLERSVVCFTDNDVDIAGVVIDQGLPQRRAIGGGRLVGLYFLDR
jgi:hypothetical protein